MKKIDLRLITVLMTVLALSFNACNKDDKPEENYEAGAIPGLGETGGELTGTPFSLPDGVEINGEITGSGDQDGYWDYGSFSAVKFTAHTFLHKDGRVWTKTSTPLKSATEGQAAHYYGSGCGYVDLLVPLHNRRSSPVTVTFPAATIIRSQSGDTQNGVLIKKTTVTVPATSDYYLCLSFYCGNLQKGSAHSGDVYVLGVVSNARPLLELCDRVKNKKINIEEFSHISPSDYYTYQIQVYELQHIVWNVTDGEGLTDNNIEYLNSLPNHL